jgi:AcrR family transcriptional regulator
MSGVRDRFRMQMQQEVKDAAVRQLAEGGPQALSINAIAKEIGVSGPALYRYFAGRDDLLTALILDAYRDMTTALTAAAEPAQAPEKRLEAVATAYRTWANAQPHRYRLLFGAPLPGYDAHDGTLVDAAQKMMNVVLDVLAGFPHRAAAPQGDLNGQLTAWARTHEVADVAPATALVGVTLWSRLHGMVSLEIERNFVSMGLDPDLLFTSEVVDLVRLASADDAQ